MKALVHLISDEGCCLLPSQCCVVESSKGRKEAEEAKDLASSLHPFHINPIHTGAALMTQSSLMSPVFQCHHIGVSVPTQELWNNTCTETIALTAAAALRISHFGLHRFVTVCPLQTLSFVLTIRDCSWCSFLLLLVLFPESQLKLNLGYRVIQNFFSSV